MIKMTNDDKQNIIDTSWQLHSMVETSYLNNLAKAGDDDWLEKQRLLLADMALHLLQTALKPDEIELSKLQNNLHAILTIADQFLPKAGLKQATKKLYQE